MTRGNPDAIRCRTNFSLVGVNCRLTAYAWLSVPLFLLIGIVVALLQFPERPILARLLAGASYGLVLFLSNMFHSIGHILAGKIVGAPPGIVIITGTFHINYHRCDPAICSRWTHIGRSAGGPIANLLLCGLAIGLHGLMGGEWLGFAAKANLIVGVWFLIPTPSFDGWVIWGELLGFRRRLPG